MLSHSLKGPRDLANVRGCDYQKIHLAPNRIAHDLKSIGLSMRRLRQTAHRSPPVRVRQRESRLLFEVVSQAARRSYRLCRLPTSGNSTTLPSSGG